MKKLFLFILLLFVILPAFSQSKIRSQLSGKIKDAKSGVPLAGASVVLADFRRGTITDTGGIYTFRNIPSGHTIIEISYTGYRTIVEHIDITGTGEKNFALTSSIVENEGVTVTGVAGAISIRKAPVPITRVSKGELLATPSANIINALTRQPGVSELSSGPAVSKPIIRGLGYNRLVTINDGVRQEGQQWGDEHGIEIDENSVSRVEILKGPASLIYGSDAIAGVVNIITTAPLPHNALRANLFSSYQTNNKQRSLFGNIGGNQNGVNWNVWGDYKAAADYKNRYDDRVFNSKFNEKNVGGYIGYNGGWGFSHLIVSRFNQKLGMIEGDRDDNGAFRKALPGGTETVATKTDYNSITPLIPYQHIRHTKVISDNSFKVGSGRLTLSLSVQRNQRQEFGNIDNREEKSLYFDLHTFNYHTAYHFDDKRGWNTTVGVNGMAQKNQNKGVEVLIPEYNLFDIGGYIYTQKTIDKVTLSGGIRYDNRTLHAKELVEGNSIKFGRFRKNFSNVSGSAGISYAATQNFTVKLNLARGFRAPSVPELASNGAHEGTNRYEYGHRNLKSETTLQGDAGIELTSEHISLSASAFYNGINNFIFYSKLAGTGGGDSLVQVGSDFIPSFQFSQRRATLPGFEARLDIHPHPLDWLHWENTISYVSGIFTEPVEGVKNVPFIPATRWISELRAEILPNGKRVKNTSLYFGADHTFDQKKPFTAFETETQTRGYTLLNAGITASITNGKKTLFSLYLLGNNLGDVAYQNHLSRLKYAAVNRATGRRGVHNLGRNFIIKLNVPFSFDAKL